MGKREEENTSNYLTEKAQKNAKRVIDVNSIVENLLNLYGENPVLRSLILLTFPMFGSVVDVNLMTKYQNVVKERLETLLDELEKGKIELTPELIESEDFIHCWIKTSEVVRRTRQREKIRMFARLFKSSALSSLLSSVDEYEEYIEILDELSYRELTILSILYKYESEFPLSAKENSYSRAKRIWKDFVNELVHDKRLCIQEEEIHSILTRISRTGCYEPIIGIGTSGETGKLTPIYYRLIKLIESETVN